MYSVILLEQAQMQLNSIVTYIRRVLRNDKAANDFKTTVREKLKSLEIEPRLYAFAPGNTKYRKVIIKNYTALFFISEETKTVMITALVYSGSDYLKKLKKD